MIIKVAGFLKAGSFTIASQSVPLCFFRRVENKYKVLFQISYVYGKPSRPGNEAIIFSESAI